MTDRAATDSELTRGWLTKADVLSVLADIERGIENSKAAMGKGLDPKSARDGDYVRRGKLQAYQYAESRLRAMARWKGMEL
jgi:hypothetical protein